jgi:hypothetical protein
MIGIQDMEQARKKQKREDENARKIKKNRREQEREYQNTKKQLT